MRTAFSLWVSLAHALCCAGQAPATVQYESLPGVPLYSSGYLLIWNHHGFPHQVTIYGRDTKPAFTVTDDKDGIFHTAWAMDSDGVLAGACQARPAWTGRIDLFDPTGKLSRTVDTGSFVPQHVAFFRDHTIWAAGYIAGNDGSDDFNVLHHYSRTGQERGQGVLWSQIAGNRNSYSALQPLIGGRRLYVSNGRIGFESYSDDGRSSWIEADSSGTFTGKYELGAWAVEPSYLPLAMTANGSVYAARYKEGAFDGWAVLDRSGKTWRKVAGYPRGRIIGTDGDRIVSATGEGAGPFSAS